VTALDAVQPSYDLFLSHSSRLDPRAEEVLEVLAPGLSRHGLRVFWDRTELAPGEPLLPSIERAIIRSKVGLLVVTTAALGSGWVELELEAMWRARRAGSMRLIALLLERGTDAPDGWQWDVIIDGSAVGARATLTDRVAAAVRDLNL